MKRNPLIVAAVCALALVLIGCQAPSKETGFPKDIDEPEQTSEPGHIEVRDSIFEPAESTVPAGTEVVWEQTGSAPHNVKAADDSFDSHPECNGTATDKCMGQGDEYTRVFEEAGEYPYYCVIHGTADGTGMAGTIIVE